MSFGFHNNCFFQLPDGAKATHMLCTTMSIDINTMLQMTAELLPDDPIDAIECVNLLHEHKALFFCCKKHNGLKMDDMSLQRIASDIKLAMLNETYTVDCRHVFHPKLILLEYTWENSLHYRLMVSSKNLTTAHSFETGVWMESFPLKNEQNQPNHNLDVFLEWLKENGQKFTGKAVPEEVRTILTRIAGELKSVRFDLPKGVPASVVEVVVSSEELNKKQDALKDALDQDTVPGSRMIILSPDYETGQEAFDNHCIYNPAGLPSHAKLYFKPGNDKEPNRLWLGSSNCTEAGLGANTECMVQLTNVEGIALTGKDTVTVFGQDCVRVTHSKLDSTKPQMSAEGELDKFIQAHEFALTEQYQTDSKRQVGIKITKKDPNYSQKKETKLLLLPAGMSEKNSSTAQNAVKWQIYAAEKTTYRFTGKKKDTPTGILRVRCEKTINNVYTAERILPLNTDFADHAFSNELHRMYEEFVHCPWLDKLPSGSKAKEKFFNKAKRKYCILKQQMPENTYLDQALTALNHYKMHYCPTQTSLLSPSALYAQPDANDVFCNAVLNNHPPVQNTIIHPSDPKFQSDAVDAACNAFRSGRTRYLVADEAGLGKTYIALGVIQRLFKQHEKTSPGKNFVVYYFGSNLYLLDKTLEKLADKNTNFNTLKKPDRMSLVVPYLSLNKLSLDPKKINLFGFSANILDDTYSTHNENEKSIYRKVEKEMKEDAFLSVRKYYNQQALTDKTLRPALIIVDEFHRYDKILTDTLAKLLEEANKDSNQPKVNLLMLSATPYNIYQKDTANFLSKVGECIENEGESVPQKPCFKSFDDVLSFLRGGDTNAGSDGYNQSAYEVYKKDGGQSAAQKAARELKKYVFRNERIYGIEDKYRDLPPATDFLCGKYDDLLPLESNSLPEPKRYFALCPGAYSFPIRTKNDSKPDRYEDFALPHECTSTPSDDQFAFDDDIQLKPDIVEGNLRFRLIREYAAQPGKELLWMPPSQVLYQPSKDSPFHRYRDYSKLLIFSGYKMVPRAVGSVFSAYASCDYKSLPKPVSLKDLDNKWSGEIVRNGMTVGLSSPYYYAPAITNQSLSDLVKEVSEKCNGDDIKAKYIIASPMLCAYRLTEDIEIAQKVADAFNTYFTKLGVCQAVDAMGIDTPEKLLNYCAEGNLQAVLTEYWYSSDDRDFSTLIEILRYGKDGIQNSEDTSDDAGKEKYYSSKVHVYSHRDYKTGCITPTPVPCLFAERFTPDFSDTGVAETNSKGRAHQRAVQDAFNSPFWPMILCTTSAGQEGIDLDRYCSRIMHFSLPGSTMAFEQRDGRVDRRISLLARKKMARIWTPHVPVALPLSKYWDWIFSQDQDESGLSPFWVQNYDPTDLRQERIVPFFPLSAEAVAYRLLLETKNAYRGAFGMPNEQLQDGKQYELLKLNELPY